MIRTGQMSDPELLEELKDHFMAPAVKELWKRYETKKAECEKQNLAMDRAMCALWDLK